MSMKYARISKDIGLILRNFAEDFKNLDTHIHYDEDDMSKFSFMIIGPEKKYDSIMNSDYNTPFFGGYYVFTVNFTDEYPIKPPEMGFKSAFKQWRCHPNFYNIGCGPLTELGTKVCLTMINTFGSEDWTPSRRLHEILLQIQERFDTCPINHEPGYEKKTVKDGDIIEVNLLMEYFNYTLGILEMMKNNDQYVLPFRSKMEESFINKYPKLINRIMELKEKYNQKTINTINYGLVPKMSCVLDYDKLLDDFEQKYFELTGEKSNLLNNIDSNKNEKNIDNSNMKDNNGDNKVDSTEKLNNKINNTNTSSPNKNLNINDTPKNTKAKKPSASLYPIDYIYKDEDGKEWIVKHNKANRKWWYAYKKI